MTSKRERRRHTDLASSGPPSSSNHNSHTCTGCPSEPEEKKAIASSCGVLGVFTPFVLPFVALPVDLGISMDVGAATLGAVALGVEAGSTGAAAAGVAVAVVVAGVEDCLGSSLTRAFAAFLTLSFIAILLSCIEG